MQREREANRIITVEDVEIEFQFKWSNNKGNGEE